jgi:hypothetical protein
MRGSIEGDFRRKTSNSKTGSGTLRGDSIYAVLMTLLINLNGCKIRYFFRFFKETK